MNKLGYEKYYIQGGNWGAVITSLMAGMFPNNVKGLHSTFCDVNSVLQFIKTTIGSYFPALVGIPKEHEHYLYPRSEKFSFLMLEMGYCHLHATKPDTVGTLFV